jgi:nucleoporin NUP42
MNQAVQEAQKLHEETMNQIRVILSDLNGAVKYVLAGENEHPNRIDITEGKLSTQQPAFGQPSATPTPSTTPAFGQPSAFGQP